VVSASARAQDSVRQWRIPLRAVSAPRPSKEEDVSILWIIIIVILVLAVLGYFGRGRMGR
jgi:hypothetical protein